MVLSNEFTCPQCGKSHQGLPTDFGYSLPDIVWAIPENERSLRAKWTKDLCQMGERYFIRCLLEIRFLHREGSFGWGLWAEVGWPVFQRYLEIYSEDGTHEPEVDGCIANQVPGYDSIVDERVLIRFGNSTQRPQIHFPGASKNQMASEQRLGIDAARHHQILAGLGLLDR